MRTLLVIWGLTCGGDALTTHHILSTGGREAWLPTQSPAMAATVAGGTCVAGIPGIAHLSKTHPTTAKVVGWSLVAFRSTVVVHNLDQIRQHTR